MHLSGLGGMKPNTIIFGFPRVLEPASLPLSEDLSLSPVSLPTRLSPREYVLILNDCLRMRKNICIARNFRSFEKKALLRNKVVNIDVWPVNFMAPQQIDNYDTPILFLLQLATVLQMSSTWRRKSVLRVFLCHRQSTNDILRRTKMLNVLLNQLRIKGKVVPVIWDDAMLHVDRAMTTTMLNGYNGKSREVSFKDI